MKFKINRDFFSSGLQLVTSVVGTRKTMPILQNVLIEAEEGKVSLTTTNLDLGATNLVINEAKEKLKLMGIALSRSQSTPGDLDKRLNDINNGLQLLSKQTSGDPLRKEVGEKSKLTIGSRLWVASMGTDDSSYGPTMTHKESLAIVKKQLANLKEELSQIVDEDIPALEEALKNAKAPAVKGSGLR